jgi:uncharacterized protein YggU (UPF0235/DUF167 family)
MIFPVRVKPGAARAAVGGTFPGRYGPAVIVSVREPAVDGRATASALRALAEALALRPADLSVRTGRTSRDKLIEVTDPPADLSARLAALLS